MSIQSDINASLKRLFASQISFSMGQSSGAKTQLWVVGKKSNQLLTKYFKPRLHHWQWEKIQEEDCTTFQFDDDGGEHWVLFPSREDKTYYMPDNLKPSDYSRFRDGAGQWVLTSGFKVGVELQLNFVSCSAEVVNGTLTGLGLALYKYKEIHHAKDLAKTKVKISAHGCRVNPKDIKNSLDRSMAINFARHLVNLPPGCLNPKVYANLLKQNFTNKKGFSVKVLTPDQLKKGGFHLIYGVGMAAKEGPYIVHLKYRSPQAKSKKPLALVGKGITFDTGGLDIKPSSGMRLMKKDMGGSAAIAGAAIWTREQQPKQNIDFYFAIAENAVSEESYRPSDVLYSRKGLSVEIHNTDAEGRLALADALTYALEAKGKDEPAAIIDVATLTGAIKVGLGSETGGVFFNNSNLAAKIMKASQQMGDHLWPMPLDQKQRRRLNSPFADLLNSTDGFGGAVTAALFLESFVGETPWAHLDIYAWNDGPRGALTEEGGSGQAVQCLTNFLEA